jgi:L-threonylcarbamoyladenylate synthase
VGMRHYAPRAHLVLIEAPLSDLPAQLARTASLYSKERVGMMLPTDLAAAGGPDITVFPWGRWGAPEEMAHSLYAGLRTLDGLGCTVVLCPVPPGGGVGEAIRDRLRKAALDK